MIKLGIPMDSARAIAIRSLLLINWPVPPPLRAGEEVEGAEGAACAEVDEVDVAIKEEVEADEADVELEDDDARVDEIKVELEEDAEASEADIEQEEVSSQDDGISQDGLQSIVEP